MRRRAPLPGIFASLLPLVLAVDKIADELLALEVAELHVRLDAAIQRHADRPRAGVDVWILDCRLVRKMIGIGTPDPLYDVEAVGMVVAGAIEKAHVNRA